MFYCLYLIEVQSNNFLPTYKSENQMASYYIFLGKIIRNCTLVHQHY